MNYLPIILRVDNYPRINFRNIAANRNRKLYCFLYVVKGVFLAFATKPQKIEKPIIESFLAIILGAEGLKVSLQADYKTN
jgi:hypothetical protein